MCVNICEKNSDLKSNMDRFIESSLTTALSPIIYLKSNMDRFIEMPDISFAYGMSKFKIQYG